MGREPRLERSEERRAASEQRSRSDPLCPVEAGRSTAGHGVDLQWRRNGPARQHHRARIGQVAGGVRARGAVRTARHLRLGMDEVPERTRLPRPRAFACARATPQKSASSCSTRATGTASRSSRPKWIEQSVTPRFQAIGYFGGLFYYGQQWWMGRTLSRRQGREMDCGPGPRRPAHLHRPRTRSCGDDHFRALWQRAAGQWPRSTSWPTSSFRMSGTTTRANQAGKAA